MLGKNTSIRSELQTAVSGEKREKGIISEIRVLKSGVIKWAPLDFLG